MPGNINPKQMEQMMKAMGMKSTVLAASEVIIKLEGKELVISNPQVTEVKVQGMTTFQIMGEVSERTAEPAKKFSEEDVKMVMEQAGVAREKAEAALEEADGDIAEAILKLQ